MAIGSAQKSRVGDQGVAAALTRFSLPVLGAVRIVARLIVRLVFHIESYRHTVDTRPITHSRISKTKCVRMLDVLSACARQSRPNLI